MARVALTVQQIVRTGLEATHAAAQTDGNSFNNTGKEFIWIKNGATDSVIDVDTPRGPDGQAVVDRTITVTATEERLIGPFPPEIYNQRGSLGDVVHFNYDSVANVTVAIVRL